ncbi:mechanosensitive ion channel protein 2, chloroplastic-like isoform X2 [Mangifera indica]|uniref:mechanosensitive ion channel protein 2, chloroplastic-like isoform X3 n=1 Tax=Mangifera indica TaxID=29780 RepID=UPI001CFB0DC0|nr:mechanosensitive ion channel protein 2, chloroplastic-like isoform X3 [Mangifera indica]XP_044481533.1 mechanosensitive ion channel protein 2, chloroplastic-like isoform X2 [Mangifera indica]
MLVMSILSEIHWPSFFSWKQESCPHCFRQQDPWRNHLSGSPYRPIHSVFYRSGSIRCHFSPLPGQACQCVKAASMEITKSFNVLQGSPLVLQLLPAIGVIVFAVWGLGPLVRYSRNMLLHKSDSNWKRSRTHYVMTSYIQPLLLWSGAILLCRTLDPVVLPTEAIQAVKLRSLNFIRSLSTVLAFAYCLSSVIQQAQKFFMETSDSSDARNMGFQFAGKAVYSAVWVASISLFMELLGFSTQRWLTAGGLGTVLLTLAGREIFTNFLSSVMIHATRPFVVNEWIQTKIQGYEVSGTVEHVGWWSPTIIRGDDREAVHIPNHKFTVNVVRNLTQRSHWRIKTHLAISHLDFHKINNIVADMRKVLAKNPQIEQQRLHRRVFLDNINSENQALLILVSCFVKTSHYEEYLCVKEAVLLDLLRVISHHRARLATPIRTVQKIFTDADLENVPFADSVYNRGGVASNRPLLLIEPSYKINGEDRAKSQTRPSHSSGEQDGKSPKPTPDVRTDSIVGGTPKSESKAGVKIAETPNPDTREDQNGDKLTKLTSKSVPKTNFKIANMSSSGSKVHGSVSDNSIKDKKMSESKQPKMGNPGNVIQNGKSENPSVSSSETSTDKGGGLQESKHVGDKLPVTQQPTSRPVLEENIVLGVALEGSKRTLPIEEDMVSPQPTEMKEMASAPPNGNGSSTNEKESKDGQSPSSSGAASSVSESS